MFGRIWKGFLAATAPATGTAAMCCVLMVTGCAVKVAPVPTPTPVPLAWLGDSQIASSHDDMRGVRGITDAQPPRQQPYWAGLDQLARKPDPVLVVITYGNGCSATSAGNGLRDVADAIRRRYPNQQVITRGHSDADGINATVAMHRGPVVLIGHSFGGCRTIELAAELHRAVDWLILLDPVPCDDWAVPHPGRYFELPPHVRNAVCFYRPAQMWPISYPLLAPLRADDNRMRLIGHNAFCRDTEVRECILDACARADVLQ